MNQYPFTRNGLNDAMNDGVFLSWAKHYSVLDQELQNMYDTWTMLLRTYKKHEYSYFLQTNDKLSRK